MAYWLLTAIHICLLMILCTLANAGDTQECPIKIESFTACEGKDTKCTIVGYDENGAELSSKVPAPKTPACARSVGGGLLKLEGKDFSSPVYVYRGEVAIKMVLPQAAICDSSTTFQSGSRGSSCK